MSATQPSTSVGSEDLLSELDAARLQTLDLVAQITTFDMERVIDPLMSPLAWDLGHIAAYEDLWLSHRTFGMDLLQPELAALYDAFETPREVRGDLGLLTYTEALDYLAAVRARVAEGTRRLGAHEFFHEMVIRHELQHTETMRQTMALGRLLPSDEPPSGHEAVSGTDRPSVVVPAGENWIGADNDCFAYDNERPRHTVVLASFAIASSPVNNQSWAEFINSDGYLREELWSPEGWAWRTDADVTAPLRWDTGEPAAPVANISFHEAEAFARFSDCRLPAEHEWEVAAAAGLLDGTGYGWEWTSSTFGGYPSFQAFPYREYSEVFFGDQYRVLRGGSWASSPRVATTTFRNWDLPQRRQIFSGLRLAADA
ncbi:MAG: SUMF1/EgtB/PvdO family nonheme iron enzyme [Solirubrobacterales bacterium]|nr:SUMF1/EgtB/PvdO family nonheme iron enzyme [Solirubrobacterales bacterium]